MAGLGIVVLALHRAGDRLPSLPLDAPDLEAALGWAGAHEPLTVAITLLHPLLLVVSGYLFGTSALLWITRLLRRPKWNRRAMRLVVPSVRPVLRAVGLGVAVSVSTAVFAPTEPADDDVPADSSIVAPAPEGIGAADPAWGGWGAQPLNGDGQPPRSPGGDPRP